MFHGFYTCGAMSHFQLHMQITFYSLVFVQNWFRHVFRHYRIDLRPRFADLGESLAPRGAVKEAPIYVVQLFVLRIMWWFFVPFRLFDVWLCQCWCLDTLSLLRNWFSMFQARDMCVKVAREAAEVQGVGEGHDGALRADGPWRSIAYSVS